MSNAAAIALVVGAVGTVLWLVALAAVTVQRAGRAIEEATRATERLGEASAAIAEHQVVTGRELDGLSDRLERLRISRAADPRRW